MAPPLVPYKPCGEGLGACDPGYECKGGKCEPTPGADDVKLTKHLFDFWSDGTPFPSNNGDVTDGHLTWYQSELDQYGEVQLKPWINPEERDLEEKWPERNLFGVEPPDELSTDVSCEEDPCPPGYKCSPESDLCVPGEGSLISQVTYPSLLYTGVKSGGYKTRDGIKNQIDTNDDAIKQWWFEEPYHPANPVPDWAQIGGFYAAYLAQIGVPLSYHWYDQDWLGQQYEIKESLLSHQAEDPPKPIGGDHPDVREVYRMAIDPVRYDAETGTWGRYDDVTGTWVEGGDPGRVPNSNRSMVGQPTGSYHGRDGMLRYNIHPWAQIYNQIRITDSLLRNGSRFSRSTKSIIKH